jgi:hypothetical protein
MAQSVDPLKLKPPVTILLGNAMDTFVDLRCDLLRLLGLLSVPLWILHCYSFRKTLQHRLEAKDPENVLSEIHSRRVKQSSPSSLRPVRVCLL